MNYFLYKNEIVRKAVEEKEKERHWECEREKVGRCVASEMKEREGEGMFTDTRYCLLCELLNSLCVCVCVRSCPCRFDVGLSLFSLWSDESFYLPYI